MELAEIYRYKEIFSIEDATVEYRNLTGNSHYSEVVKVDGVIDTGIAEGRKVLYWLKPQWDEIYGNFLKAHSVSV